MNITQLLADDIEFAKNLSPANSYSSAAWEKRRSASGGALDVVVVVALDPGHQVAQLVTGRLDRVASPSARGAA